MKKQVLSLSVASAIVLAGAMPIAHAVEECEINGVSGVLVQSRFALANCLIESAVAIAAANATDNGCEEGEWEIDAIVPEWHAATVPIQGLAFVEKDDDGYELNGSSSAMLKNSVNCQISTTASGNTFDGEDLVYSTGSGNLYVNAVIDKDNHLICITESQSSGNISIGDEDSDEDNSLSFDEVAGNIEASGMLSILKGRGQGPNAKKDVVSAWMIAEAVSIPELCDNTAEECEATEDAFWLQATTSDLDTGDSVCKITVDASVINLTFFTEEGEEGGLTISGKLLVKGEDADDDDEADD